MTITTNRRAIVKGAAWATPVVLATSAIPAFAASRLCSTASYSQMTWGTVKENLYGTDGPTSTNTASVILEGTTYNAAISTARSGDSEEIRALGFELLTGLNPDTFAKEDAYYASGVSPYNKYWHDRHGVANLGTKTYGGTPNMMMLSMVAPTTGMTSVNPLGQTVTVTFDKPVSMVQFSVSDIDAHWVDKYGKEWGTGGTTKYGYHDQIVVSANGGTVSAATNPANDIVIKQISSSSVSATAQDGYSVTEAQYQSNKEAATVTFTICGPLTQFTIGYYNVDAVNGMRFDDSVDASWFLLDQQVYISPLSIKANCTPCQ